MTTTEIATLAPTDCARLINEHLAAKLNGLDYVHGAFVRTTATLGADGFIIVDVKQWAPGFDGPDGTIRVLLHPTQPVDITPTSASEVELVGETALDAPAVPVESEREPASPTPVGALDGPTGGVA